MDYRLHLEAVEAALDRGILKPETVRAFYEQSVSENQLDQARRIFDKLQGQFPSDRGIGSLYIALCLLQKDYTAAMTQIETLVANCTPDDGLLDAGLAVRAKLGPIRISDSVPFCDTISLCMIVRDEIAGIGACLRGVRSVVDEIIVVDTGSADRTRDAAEILGARTFAFDWSNDFSAARNFSLDQARGSWILILDADEMIASRDHQAFKSLVAGQRSQPMAFAVETRNYTHTANAIGWQGNDGSYPQHEAGLGWFPSRKVRLFPNQNTIRFCHPVHEQVEAALHAAGIPVTDCPMPVHHYGNLNEARTKKKAGIYFELGYAKLDQLGNDFQALRELASQAGQLERWPEAVELWERLLWLDPINAEAYVNLASGYWQMGRYHLALEKAQKAADLAPDMREAHYNLAVNHLLLGNARQASQILGELVNGNAHYLPAVFMYAMSSCCLGDAHRCRQNLDMLKTTKACAAIPMAIDDLKNRCRQSGLHAYADAIDTATGASAFGTAHGQSE